MQLIKFDKTTKTFTIENNDISYIFYVNHENILVNLYFGKKINQLSKDSYEFINNMYADKYTYFDINKKEEVINDQYFSGIASRVEIPSFGTFDKRIAAIKIKNIDEVDLTDFRYVSHEIYKGKPTFINLPYIRENNSYIETLKVVLKDRKDEIYLNTFYSILKDKNVIIRHNEIINKTNHKIKISKICSLSIDLPTNEYDLISLHGTYATDRLIEKQEIKHNTIVIETNTNGKSFYHNPMAILINNNKNYNTTEAIGFGLVYSGNFKLEVNGTEMNSTRVIFGINDESFLYSLNEEETFISPEAILVYSENGVDNLTNTFHDLIRENLIRKETYIDKSILLNSWEAFEMKFDTNKIIEFIKKASELGINLVVLDDGWFINRDDDTGGLGDWEINHKKIDLKAVINYAHQLNVKFGLRIEPEMISFNSKIFKAHPEYALGYNKLNLTTFRHQLVMDLTNNEVIDYIFKKISNIFDNYEIDYCKWDFNRVLTEPYSNNSLNHGEIYHRFILGTYDLLNRFINRYPKILLETCSGGGGRFDLGMLFYSPQIWASDETDGISRTFIQYSTYLFYPLCVIGSHTSNRKYLSIKEKSAISMFGTFGYELDITKLDPIQENEIIISNKRYLDNEDLIKNGDYYSLIAPFNSNFISFELVAKNKSKAVVFFMNYLQVNWFSRYLKLKGLDKNKLYKNSFNGGIYKGDFYMNIGINLSMGMASFTPQLIELDEVYE